MTEKIKKARAGFIYICQTENDWLKIGFTRSLPHRRLKNLSSTGSRTGFVIHAAKYMHDALSAERFLHKRLTEKNIDKQKEFFKMPLEDAKSLLLEVFYKDKQISKSKIFHMTSGEEEVDMTDSLKMLERLSVQGNPYASFKVAQSLVVKRMWAEASIMFEASFDQGLPDALLYQKHIDSFRGLCSKEEFLTLLLPHAKSLDLGYYVSERTKELLEIEQASWKHDPTRATAWGVLCSPKIDQEDHPPILVSAPKA